MKAQNELFDDSAPQYSAYFPAHVAQHYLDKRLAYIQALKPEGPVLELGCGTGTLAGELKARGFKLFGADASHGMLAEMAAKGHVSGVQALAEKLPFPDGTFDLVLNIVLLHHLLDAAGVRAALLEMVRVTKPGGRILVWDHNSLNPYWTVFMRKLPWDAHVKRLVPLREILAAFREAKVSELSWKRLGFMPDFAPAPLLPLFRGAEKVVEAVPGLNLLAAHNVVLARK